MSIKINKKMEDELFQVNRFAFLKGTHNVYRLLLKQVKRLPDKRTENIAYLKGHTVR